MESRLPPFARKLLPPLVYLGLALALTWPLAGELSRYVVGAPRSDAWNSLWSLWFVHDALVGGHLPLETTLLDHPMGGRLVVADPLNALLGYPLVSLFGLVAGYNLLVIAHSAFSGLAAHALGRALGGQGWLAGVAFQASPLLISHLHNGSSEAIAAGWLPLAGLATLRLVQAPSWGRAALAGLALATCAISGWYAGLGAWCLFFALALFHVRAWRELLVAAGLALALTLPVADAVRSVAQDPNGLVHIKNDADLARLRRTIGPADPRVFFAPGDFRSPDFAKLEGAPADYVHTTYLGWVLLLLALIGTARSERRDQAWPFWLAGAGGAVLALGPVLVMDGYPVAFAGRAVPLPYLLLERLPGFNALSLLYRIAGVTALAVAVVADLTLPRRWLLPALALVGLEVSLASPARGLPELTRVPDSSALQALAEAPDGAVINLPVSAARSYLFEQTIHRKPLASSLNTGANRASLAVLAAARRLKSGEMSPQDLADVATGQRVRYVVVHKDLLISETFVESATALRRFFPLVAEDHLVRVHQLY
ncbi:MAG: hypothetical protein H6741_06365 [Alphaproteobacteria bacterium]|nr:hypothetical protein [Alphaproteobacteria bacterium]MCB9792334.1 hypothetical protein [Alphaproteobacteria bacterium]